MGFYKKGGWGGSSKSRLGGSWWCKPRLNVNRGGIGSYFSLWYDLTVDLNLQPSRLWVDTPPLGVRNWLLVTAVFWTGRFEYVCP